jgi:hypothetical protein
MNADHDIAIAFHGGPFDGELLTTRCGRLPRSVPWPDGGLIHLYTLLIDDKSAEDFVNIRYVYSGCHSPENIVT